jgi:hypothetical protein
LFDKNEEQAKSILKQIQKIIIEGSGGSSTCVTMMHNADKTLYIVKKNEKDAVLFFSENNNIYI